MVENKTLVTKNKAEKVNSEQEFTVAEEKQEKKEYVSARVQMIEAGVGNGNWKMCLESILNTLELMIRVVKANKVQGVDHKETRGEKDTKVELLITVDSSVDNIQSINEMREFPCLHCDSVFPNKSRLNRHLVSHQSGVKKKR